MEKLLNNHKFHLFVIVFLAVVAIFGRLHESKGLSIYDDLFYAEKAKEIVVTNDWITIRYNYSPHFHNPPVHFWLVALMYKLFGINDYIAKLSSALLGLATIIMVYYIGRYFFDHWTGIIASFVLLTTHYYFSHTQRCMLDITTTFFVTAAIFSFIKGLERDRYFFLLFGFFTGLGVLTKSAIGFSPIAISIIYLLISRNKTTNVKYYFIYGITAFILTASPWFLIQYAMYGANFGYHLFKELIYNLFVQGDCYSPQKEFSLFKYFVYLAGQSMPWVIFGFLGIYKLLKNIFKGKDTRALLLLVWIGTIFGGLSLAREKKPWYIMSIYPAFSIISAYCINSWLNEKGRRVFIKIILIITLLTTIIVFALPVKLAKDKNVEMMNLMPYIERLMSDNHTKLLVYNMNYWPVQHPVLYYTNKSAEWPIENENFLKNEMNSKNKLLCITNRKSYDSLSNKYNLIKIEGDFILFSNFKY